MASGDITKIQELGRISLPGGGNTTAGKQRQNKVLVWGKVTCTNVSTGINPASATGILGAGGTLAKIFSVENIDFCELTVNDQGAGENNDVDAMHYYALDRGSNLIHGLEDLGHPTRASAAGDGDILDLRYLVVGDASSYAELT
jgi:hypothetical protein